ncbi:MAG: hypothetical protein QXU18_13845 [Thermoplasmatales archaeon]
MLNKIFITGIFSRSAVRFKDAIEIRGKSGRMRKNTVIIGVAILLIGIIMIGLSFGEVDKAIQITSANMTLTDKDYSISPAITISGELKMIIISNHTVYLIPSQDAPILNSTNIASFSVHPSLTEGGSSLFYNLNGVYYIVAPGNNVPEVSYGLMDLNNSLIISYGLLLIVGLALLVAGIIITVVGIFLKRKVN